MAAGGGTKAVITALGANIGIAIAPLRLQISVEPDLPGRDGGAPADE